MPKGYQLKITIQGSHPTIWRRVIVPEKITFYDLDDIIEAVFGWTHSHLFMFKVGDKRFEGSPYPEEDETTDSAAEPIDLWLYESAKLTYIYDFGDDWHHTILVEKIVDYEYRYPVVVKSKGPMMIEDCGGIWGFYGWIDEAEPFDQEQMNERLSKWHIDEAEIQDDQIRARDYALRERLVEHMKKISLSMQASADDRQLKRPEHLADIYAHYTVDDLRNIVKAFNIDGCAKLKKQELICRLTGELLSEKYFKEMILYSNPDEVQIFEDAMQEETIYTDETLIICSVLLSAYGGFVQLKEMYCVPEDVADAYKKLKTPQFEEEKERIDTLRTYCSSAVYLYGVCTLAQIQQFYEIYGRKPEESEWLHVQAEKLSAFGAPFSICDGYIMDDELAEENMYENVLKAQEDIPRYIPKEEDEFCLYGDLNCQEEDEQTAFFRRDLREKMGVSEPYDHMIFYEIQDEIRLNADMEDIFELLQAYGIRLKNVRHRNGFKSLVEKLRQYIRTWDLNGHMPAELAKMADSES